MKKKTLGRLITGIMVASLLTGCGNSETEAARATVAEEIMTEKEANNIFVETSPEYEYPTETEATCEEAYDIEYNGSNNKTDVFRDTAPSYQEECETSIYDDYYGHSYNDNEEYSVIKENGFSDAKTNPLSTFAADVDTASYSNFRRFVDDGYRLGEIPTGAIRTEEMVNYFTYNYDQPSGKDIFGVNATISDCPWNRDSKLMVLGINTKDMQPEKRPDSNIVFLIDVSGSMKSANKLPLIQSSMEMLVDQFGENDRISIVTYASGTDVVLDSEFGDSHRRIMRAFNRLKAGGSTNGGDGIKLAYELAEKNFIEDGVNRVIICSDGDFNVGLTSQSELEDLIKKEKESGVFLSVLGFGMSNYKDTKMETLADCGNGNYAYIDTIGEAKKVFVDEMMQNMVTVAKDVKLQVEFNPALVSEYRLVGYENRALAAQDFKDDTKDGGELGAGHEVTAIYEIKLADDKNSDSDLKYQDNELTEKGKAQDEYCTVSIAYKDIDSDSSRYLEFPIDADNYTRRPDDRFVFASSVAECSLALRNSEYLVDVSPEEAIEDIIEKLEEMDRLDEYQKEFVELLEMIIYKRR